MNILILTTALALSMDAFTISVSKAMSIKNMTMYLSLKIAIFFGFFQGFMSFLGGVLGVSFEKYIIAIDHWIALILLYYLGFRMIMQFIEERKNTNNISVNTDASSITNGELIILSIATSIDALVVGISFVFTNIDIISASITISIATFIMCLFGCIIGSKFGRVFSSYANLIGGVILIIIAFSIFNEHTGFINNVIGIA